MWRGGAAPHRDTFFDMLGKRKAKLANQIKNKSKETISQGQLKVYETTVFFFFERRHVRAKVGKGVWRMPWLLQAMKDVTSCDKPRVGANDL